tara:strand:+ start:6462 stop:6983 length:522 start_codon:yes stop_codon:yes gene_type:complete
MEEILGNINAEMKKQLETKQHALITEDPRMNYMVVPLPPKSELGFLEDSDPDGTGIGLAPNEVMTPIEKYDFYIPLSEDDKENTKHTEPLKYSFLQIKEGEVDKGIDWYKRYYPKIPDELIEIMARYNFGDLKYATKKKIRNDGKKYIKKYNKKPEAIKGLTINHAPQIITFD